MGNYRYRGLGDIPAADPASPIVPGPRPGMLYIKSTGEYVDAKSWNEEPIYDSEVIATPFAAGNRVILFRNTNNFVTGVAKDLRYTNMVGQSQLPSGWFAQVNMMSIRVLQLETAAGSGLFTTPEDVQRILEEGVLTFETGNQKVEKEAPLYHWPCPIGPSGFGMRTGAAFTSFSAVNNGVPSFAATKELELPVVLSNELTFQATLTFPGGLTLDNNCIVQMILFTYMSKPLR